MDQCDVLKGRGVKAKVNTGDGDWDPRRRSEDLFAGVNTKIKLNF